jgi:UDP-N-acetylmuramate dehydrogenase
MDKQIKDTLRHMFGDNVRFDFPMSELTTFRIGGNAEALCYVQDAEDLRKVVALLGQWHVPHLVVGKGSNLLVRDGGLEGAVLILQGELARVKQKGDPVEGCVAAGAGAPLSDLLAHCRQRGWSGLEFLAGIPGTVGGAVVMNAGAFGGEIGDCIEEVQFLVPGKAIAKRSRDDLEFRYRSLALEQGCIVVQGNFRLQKSSSGTVARRIAENLKRRRETQPMAYPSAGSVFKNPPGDYAGRLIESAGLKGEAIGNAKVSEDHANYIVNLGNARAQDVLALMDLIQTRVRENTGIDLEPEIKVVGREY